MDETKEYVRATLTLALPPSYPADPPSMSLSSTRGLGDSDIADILRVLGEKAEELRGEPMLWQLLEVRPAVSLTHMRILHRVSVGYAMSIGLGLFSVCPAVLLPSKSCSKQSLSSLPRVARGAHERLLHVFIRQPLN